MVILFRFHHGPSEKTVPSLTKGALFYRVSASTVIVPKEPFTVFKADVLCIIEDGGFEISSIVFVINVVQIPSAAEQISLCPSTFGNGAG